MLHRYYGALLDSQFLLCTTRRLLWRRPCSVRKDHLLHLFCTTRRLLLCRRCIIRKDHLLHHFGVVLKKELLDVTRRVLRAAVDAS